MEEIMKSFFIALLCWFALLVSGYLVCSFAFVQWFPINPLEWDETARFGAGITFFAAMTIGVAFHYDSK